jgi:hypothetical protein
MEHFGYSLYHLLSFVSNIINIAADPAVQQQPFYLFSKHHWKNGDNIFVSR